MVEIDLQVHTDHRGFFARTWCAREFEEQGLNSQLVQCSISFNTAKGTLRGIHYQAAPFAENKLIRCTAGAIWDVALDLRAESPTYLAWHGTVLSARNHKALYVPAGCAHGFLSLEDNSEILYQMSEFFHPELSQGVRWNDPAFSIDWPDAVTVISERDRSYPDFNGKE